MPASVFTYSSSTPSSPAKSEPTNSFSAVPLTPHPTPQPVQQPQQQPPPQPLSPTPPLHKPFPLKGKPSRKRFFLSLAIIVVGIVGLIATLILITLNQDVRQQAYEVEYSGDTPQTMGPGSCIPVLTQANQNATFVCSTGSSYTVATSECASGQKCKTIAQSGGCFDTSRQVCNTTVTDLSSCISGKYCGVPPVVGTPIPANSIPTACTDIITQGLCATKSYCQWDANANKCVYPPTATPPPTPLRYGDGSCVPSNYTGAPNSYCASGTSHATSACTSGQKCGPTPTKITVGPNSCVDINTQNCPVGIQPQAVPTAECNTRMKCVLITVTPTPTPTPTPTLTSANAPNQLTERCSTSGETICRYNWTYRCSTPFTQYQKTTVACGEGTANVGAIVNCCINGAVQQRTIDACLANQGTVGVCAKENMCVTAFGDVAYGSSAYGNCAQGVRTVITCSPAGVVMSSQTREGCVQPTPNPSPTARPSLFGQCFVTSNNCTQATAAQCSQPVWYDTKTQCLNALVQINSVDCNPILFNCLNQSITVWLTN